MIVGGFAAIFLSLVAIDLAGRRSDTRIAPLATTLIAAMRTRVGRLIVFGWWLWIGFHFLAR
jgi:Family of unknown function (DUF6186)